MSRIFPTGYSAAIDVNVANTTRVAEVLKLWVRKNASETSAPMDRLSAIASTKSSKEAEWLPVSPERRVAEKGHPRTRADQQKRERDDHSWR